MQMKTRPAIDSVRVNAGNDLRYTASRYLAKSLPPGAKAAGDSGGLVAGRTMMFKTTAPTRENMSLPEYRKHDEFTEQSFFFPPEDLLPEDQSPVAQAFWIVSKCCYEFPSVSFPLFQVQAHKLFDTRQDVEVFPFLHLLPPIPPARHQCSNSCPGKRRGGRFSFEVKHVCRHAGTDHGHQLVKAGRTSAEFR